MLTPEEVAKTFELLELKTQEQRDTMLSQAQPKIVTQRVIVHLRASNMTTTETTEAARP